MEEGLTLEEGLTMEDGTWEDGSASAANYAIQNVSVDDPPDNRGLEKSCDDNQVIEA